jgi:predicted RNase H-like HicB family nuclease
VQFEVELYRDETGMWVATAVEHGVTATGHTEKEALARIMEALAAHFKRAAR